MDISKMQYLFRSAWVCYHMLELLIVDTRTIPTTLKGGLIHDSRQMFGLCRNMDRLSSLADSSRVEKSNRGVKNHSRQVGLINNT